MVLSKGGPDFQALASPGGPAGKTAEDVLQSLQREPEPAYAPEPEPAPKPESELEGESPAASEELPIEPLEVDDGPSLYRVRVKAVGTPRIRTLTLAAASESAVRESVLSDLEGDWEVLDVEVDPLDI